MCNRVCIDRTRLGMKHKKYSVNFFSEFDELLSNCIEVLCFLFLDDNMQTKWVSLLSIVHLRIGSI